MLFRPLASAFIVGKCLAGGSENDALMQSQSRNEDALEFVNGKDRVQLSELHKSLYQHHHAYTEAKEEVSGVHNKFHSRLTQHHREVVSAGVKTSVHAEKLKKTARQMESEYRRILEMMVAEPQLGEEYKPPVQAIEAVEQTFETMRVQLVSEQGTSQNMIAGANEVIADVNDRMEGRFNKPVTGVNATELVSNTAQAAHEACRVQENALIKISKDQCTIFNNYDRCGSNTGLKSHEQNWFVHYKDTAVPANQQGTSLKTMVDNAHTCRTNLIMEHAKAHECDGDQEEYEIAFCEYAFNLETTSRQYDREYLAANNSRNDIVAAVLTIETDGKLILKMVKKIECYLQTLKAVQATNSMPTLDDLNACVTEDPDVSDLDIQYTACEAKTDLKSELYKIRHWPGSDTGGWAAEKYGDNLFHHDVKQDPWNNPKNPGNPGPGQAALSPNKLNAIKVCGTVGQPETPP